jgi:hypothetical protein
MDKTILPEYYDAEDRANYDDLISRGQALIGKKISKQDEFLLDMSAKITINQIKGYKNDMTDEEIKEQMKKHKDALTETVVYTPENMYEEGQHPLELNRTKTDIPHGDPEINHPSDLNILE